MLDRTQRHPADQHREARVIRDLCDTSSIPDDAAYWRVFGERVTTAAVTRSSALAWLAGGGGGWVIAASLIAAAAVLVARTQRPAASVRAAELWAAALLPQDNIAQSLARGAAPPAIAELLITGTRPEEGNP